MGPRWRRRLNLGLLVLLAVLAAGWLALLGQWLAQASPLPAPGQTAAAAAGRADSPPGRDPFAAPAGQGPLAAREDALEVLGVVVGKGETLALVRHGVLVRRLRPGESVGRYKLKEVRGDRAVFIGPDGERAREVTLKKRPLPGEGNPRKRQ